MKPRRMTAEGRKIELLEVATRVAEEKGFAAMSGPDIGRAASCSHGLIFVYWRSMRELRRDVMRAAIASENLLIVAQGLGCLDPDARKASPELKEKALALLSA